MPTNPERMNHLARIKIDKMLPQNKTHEMLMADIVRQVTLSYPVSPGMVEHYIMKCYVEPGYLVVTDGTIIFRKSWK